MPVSTRNIIYEKWLIGAISAWDKHEMTTISYSFPFSIMLTKLSHFLACLLIMNCTVLCPFGSFSWRPKLWCQTPWQRLDFNKAMGKFIFKGRKQCLETRWLPNTRLKARPAGSVWPFHTLTHKHWSLKSNGPSESTPRPVAVTQSCATCGHMSSWLGVWPAVCDSIPCSRRVADKVEG